MNLTDEQIRQSFEKDIHTRCQNPCLDRHPHYADYYVDDEIQNEWESYILGFKAALSLQASEQEATPLKSTEDINTIYRILYYYANTETYRAPRTGGVLAGCPRGNPPSPQHLVWEAKRGLAILCKLVGKQPEEWMLKPPPLTTEKEAELVRKCAELAPEECKSCSGRGSVYFGDPEPECPCPECDGSGEQPNSAILALLPEGSEG